MPSKRNTIMSDPIPSHPKANGTHAIVIGGSMTGLLAARVLSDYFDRVTIIERDKLPQGPEQRNGVPQARHVHQLLTSGKKILDDLFPGFDTDLDTAGALKARWGLETAAYGAAGWACAFDSGITTRSISRVQLEWLVRRRIAQIPNITFMEETQVNGLLAAPDNSRITGVRVESRTGAHEGQELCGDLVVDASGRESHTPDWLNAMGYEKPAVTVVNSYVGYATRWYERPADTKFPWKILLVNSRPPDLLRQAALLEVEDGRWMCTLIGMNKDYPPTDEAGYLDFARSLLTPKVYEAIKDAQPLSPVYGYQRTANQQRHYERLKRMPENLIVMGDAACAFNPIYGQGMTVGAMEAMELDACLGELRGQNERQPDVRLNLSGMNLRFQKRLAKVLANPWQLATGEDLRYPGTEGARPNWLIRQSQKYVVQTFKALPHDTHLALDFLLVLNLEVPPTVLFKPRHIITVVRYMLKGEKGAVLDAPLVLEYP
jgi:2-polyprenyl-6-methoxyphenol hydroxylase-like FAD-dependent oxidoreductase